MWDQRDIKERLLENTIIDRVEEKTEIRSNHERSIEFNINSSQKLLLNQN